MVVVDSRIAERYRRLRALASSPNEHESARARVLAERLALQHDLAFATMRAFTPAGSILVRDRPWWSAVVLTHAASHVAGIAPVTWTSENADMALELCGARFAIEHLRILYAGARLAIMCGPARVAGATLDDVDAFRLAAAAAFGRGLWMIAERRRPYGPRALVLWEPQPEPLPLAPLDVPEPVRAALVARSNDETRDLLRRSRYAVDMGVRLGERLASQLELSSSYRWL
jgi:hypothetical protein